MAEHDARKLLDFILHDRLQTFEEKQAEFATRAIDPGDQPAVVAGDNMQTEEDAAGRLGLAFVTGLQALAAGRAGGQPLVLDDADPGQNDMADALIRFLVKVNLATVETEELGPDHYRYHVTADWPGLERTATLAGVDLQAALTA